MQSSGPELRDPSPTSSDPSGKCSHGILRASCGTQHNWDGVILMSVSRNEGKLLEVGCVSVFALYHILRALHSAGYTEGLRMVK